MVFKGCQRCSGDLWIEMDMGSRLEDLVCLQCGHRQAAQLSDPGPGARGLTGSWRSVPEPRPGIAAITSGQLVRRAKTISSDPQQFERKLRLQPRFANGDVWMSESATEKLLAHMIEDMPE